MKELFVLPLALVSGVDAASGCGSLYRALREKEHLVLALTLQLQQVEDKLAVLVERGTRSTPHNFDGGGWDRMGEEEEERAEKEEVDKEEDEKAAGGGREEEAEKEEGEEAADGGLSLIHI